MGCVRGLATVWSGVPGRCGFSGLPGRGGHGRESSMGDRSLDALPVAKAVGCGMGEHGVMGCVFPSIRTG